MYVTVSLHVMGTMYVPIKILLTKPPIKVSDDHRPNDPVERLSGDSELSSDNKAQVAR